MKVPTWAIIGGAVLVGTAYGPLDTLATVSPELVDDAGYWRIVATEALRSFAEAAKFGIGLAAGALGIPIVARGIERVTSSGSAVEPPA
jgi:hypothetical protein